MPLTQLDPVTALITIDLQKGIVGMPTVHAIGGVISNASKLARAFRKHGLPVVLVNVSGIAPGRTDAGRMNLPASSDWTHLVPELDEQSSDHLVTKQRWGAFIGTDLDDYLRKQGVTQIVLAGVATSIGVESTARCAYELGYNVVLVTDAMTDRDAEAHRMSLEKIFPRLGETDTTQNVLNLLNARS